MMNLMTKGYFHIWEAIILPEGNTRLEGTLQLGTRPLGTLHKGTRPLGIPHKDTRRLVIPVNIHHQLVIPVHMPQATQAHFFDLTLYCDLLCLCSGSQP